MVFPSLVLMGLKRMIRYPWGLVLSIVIDPFVLVLNLALFTSIFSHAGTDRIAGYGMYQMIWYFAACGFMWYCIWNFTDRNMSMRVISGDLTLDLIRPVSIFTIELSRAIALRLSGVLFEFVPLLSIYLVFVPQDFITPATILRFTLSAVGAFLLFFAINFLIGLSANVIQNASAAAAIKHVFVASLGGSLIPLDFFPQPYSGILKNLPFACLFHWPIQFFLGRETEWIFFARRIAICGAWIALFLLADFVLWRRSIRHFSGAGG